MLYTENAARENVRSLDGKRVFCLGPDDRLTPAARSWLRLEHIEVLPAPETGQPEPAPGKPEHMTHLNTKTLVPKTHPRIALRGMVDTLEAELLLLRTDADNAETARALDEILNAVRTAMRSEVLDEPMGETVLCGMNPEELRERSHHPEKYYGQPHFMPGAEDGPLLLGLNRLRTLVRQCELAACRAFPEGREDLLRFWNRLSSLIWILIILRKKEESAWN